MRLIDADKLIDMLYDNEFTVLCPLDEVSGVVDAAPTVNAAVVTQCKDCKWSDKNRRNIAEKRYQDNVLFCRNNDLCGNEPLAMYPDDFCSYGERKDVNE